MTLPSVGWIVHYVARGSADGVFPVTCRAAIVTDAPPDTGVLGLAVLNPDGILFAQDIPEGEQGTDLVGGTWHWPERV